MKMMKQWAICLAGMLLVLATSAAARQSDGDLSGYLPDDGEVPGWSSNGPSDHYRGDDLFMMINGGAGIYHEYGFQQVISAGYVNVSGTSITLEIYEMQDPAAAYGIYTFKRGDSGRAVEIGQEALLEAYYLNFWKGNLLVTVIGPDSEDETTEGIIAIAKAVDGRITKTGQRPGLARLLLGDPPAFSRPKYVRGPLGVMSSYLFDTQNILGVRAGLIGAIGDCRAFVFQYADEKERSRYYQQALAAFNDNPGFKIRPRPDNHCSMVGPDGELIVISQTGRYIAIVMGDDREQMEQALAGINQKLKKE